MLLSSLKQLFSIKSVLILSHFWNLFTALHINQKTQHSLVKMIESLKESFDQGKSDGAIFMDLSTWTFPKSLIL